ncbi:LPXTG cell wall anchor domain-containing protein [Streptococcus bouchesdurhonensis]|uniref:LPXTG cell wall anchor domain-containing protein n=1 Tax=Streptococcus bouchesdurhonensis TaxID=2954240 RepID=UPI003CE5C63C
MTPKKADGSTYPAGSKVLIPGENNTPIEVTIGANGSGEVANDKLPQADVVGTGTVTEPNKKASQPVAVTTPARKTATIELSQDPTTGDVTVTPKRPDGSTYPKGTKVELPGKDGRPIEVTIGDNGSAKVPNDQLPDTKVSGKAKIKEPGKAAVEVPKVDTPAKLTVSTEQPSKIEITRKPNGDAVVTPKKADGSTYPAGSKVLIPGENNTPIEVTIGANGSGEVANDKLPQADVVGTGTVTEPNKKASKPVAVTTPARKTATIELSQDPTTGDVTVTPKRPDGSTYPKGTKVELPGKDGRPIEVTIGDNGSAKVPNDQLPDTKVSGKAKIKEPGKAAVEVPKVDTPAKLTVSTEQPSKIEITRKPNGDAVVTPKKADGSTYPAGSKVLIPGENNTPIEVTIGANGSGEVANDKLPQADVVGTGTVTEPNKKASKPVAVTTPARKTATIELSQDPTTGDVTVTPKRPDGSTYPKGTKVELPGKDGRPIEVTIGDNGSAKVPNDQLPDTKVSGKAKIKEPGKAAVEVPNVTTPAKLTPATPETEKPGKIEITQQPNGNAIVTPKKPDGTTYPSGTKVEIPGENGTTITVTIGDNGSGEVPNDKLPKTKVPGTGKVTEPNKKPSQPVDVTTPARKTPTVELSQDPTTGDVTVTPKKPDGSTYPEGTIVELPGKDGRPIKVTIGADGSAKVPNDQLPDTTVVGNAKITEPGKAAVEVPNVTTPAKLTVSTEQPSKSHNVLPNTGTESNATLASLGLLGMLSGLGFAFRKKKED